MVKTTAQTLQAFGTELAETELPNDAEATTNLLHTHSLKKEKMKVENAFFSVFRSPISILNLTVLHSTSIFFVQLPGGSAGGGVSRWSPVGLY